MSLIKIITAVFLAVTLDAVPTVSTPIDNHKGIGYTSGADLYFQLHRRTNSRSASPSRHHSDPKVPHVMKAETIKRATQVATHRQNKPRCSTDI